MSQKRFNKAMDAIRVWAACPTAEKEDYAKTALRRAGFPYRCSERQTSLYWDICKREQHKTGNNFMKRVTTDDLKLWGTEQGIKTF